MSDRAAYPRERRGFFRSLGILLAIALCGTGVYLVVVGHTQKQVQIGLLVGLWGALMGAFALFGPRRERVTDADEVVAAAARKAPEVERGLVRRRDAALEREVAMRREMERVLRDELSKLRDAVTGLRNDLNENTGAQLRMERIETTRVISSDVDERQMRQLTGGHPAIEANGFPPATITESRTHVSGPVPYVRGPLSTASERPAVIDVMARPRPGPHPTQRPAVASIEAPAPVAPAAGASAPGPASGPPRGGTSGAAQPSRPSVPPREDPLARPAAAASEGWTPSTTSRGASLGRPGLGAPSGLAAAGLAGGSGLSGMTGSAPQPAGAAPPGSASLTHDDAMTRPWPSITSTPSTPPASAAASPSTPSVPGAPPTSPGSGWTDVSYPSPSSMARAEPTPPRPAQPAPPGAAEPAADPLAGLPRLSRFDYDFEEPARPPAPRPVEPPAFGSGQRPTDSNGASRSGGSRRPARSPYVGRRRSAGERPAFDSPVPEPSQPQSPPGSFGGADSQGGNGAGYGTTRYGGQPDGSAGVNGFGASYGNGPSGANATYNGVGGANGAPAYGNGGPGYPSGTSPYGSGVSAPTYGTPANGNDPLAYRNGTPPNGTQPAAGGRRRRADDDANEILARLLGR